MAQINFTPKEQRTKIDFTPKVEPEPETNLLGPLSKVAKSAFTTPEFVSKGFDWLRENPALTRNIPVLGTEIPFRGETYKPGLALLEGMSTPGDIALMAGTGGTGFLRKGVQKGASALLGLRGGERMITAESPTELGTGALETTFGLFGLRGSRGATQAPKIVEEAASGAKLPKFTAKVGSRMVDIATPKAAWYPGTTDNWINALKDFNQQAANLGATATRAVPEAVKGAPAIVEAWNLGRALMTAYDISAVGRQGLPLISKKAFWTSFNPMFKSLGGEKGYQMVMQSIKDSPLFRIRYGKATAAYPGGVPLRSYADEAGLHITELTRRLSRREEAIMSTWAEKVPGVRASNRAYTSYLNKLRADLFDDFIKQADALNMDPLNNPQLLKTYADWINTATGRGSLNIKLPFGAGTIELEKMAVEAGSVVFAPRLISSRIRMLNRTLNPMYYVKADPVLRKESLRALLSVAGSGLAFGQVAKLAGAEVESDPRSSDFGKIRVDRTRVDPFAGFQQYGVLAARMLTNKTVSSTTGKEYELGEGLVGDRFDILTQFGVNKLHPMSSFLVAMLKGQEPGGAPFEIPESIIRRYIPMVMQDLYEVQQENPELLPITLPVSLIGLGVQAY